MKVAVVSEDFHTLSGRVGDARRFLLYEVPQGARPRLEHYFQLPVNCPTFEELGGETASFHPIDGMVVMASEARESCVELLARRGSPVVITSVSDPQTAVVRWAAGQQVVGSLASRSRETPPRPDLPSMDRVKNNLHSRLTKDGAVSAGTTQEGTGCF